MKKYFFAFLLMVNLKGFAQDYKIQIEAYRKQYMLDFLEDKSSPLKKEDLQYLRFYSPDSTYRITAKVALQVNPPAFTIATFTGTGDNYVKYAILTMTVKGRAVKLSVYKNTAFANSPQLKDYVFLPFTDDTNGKETYAGGRYIDLREKDFKNNTVIIDFNKAYNPYCAFGGGYSCPKPPDENHLLIAISAGEKTYAGSVKH
jgi:uncharacterized protein (DUF1684 family)